MGQYYNLANTVDHPISGTLSCLRLRIYLVWRSLILRLILRVLKSLAPDRTSGQSFVPPGIKLPLSILLTEPVNSSQVEISEYLISSGVFLPIPMVSPLSLSQRR